MQHSTEIRSVDELRVIGRLVDDAQLTFTAGAHPHAVLCLEIAPAVGQPYRVRQDMGDDPTLHFALAGMVARLRRGSVVQVTAKGLLAQSDHGRAGLRLLGVTDVSPLPQLAAPAAAHPVQEA